MSPLAELGPRPCPPPVCSREVMLQWASPDAWSLNLMEEEDKVIPGGKVWML